jgi:hypothetical protein
MGTLADNCKSEQQRDSYAWEDNVGITQVDEAQVSADEDDPQFSSTKGSVSNKLKGISCTAGKGLTNDMAGVEKVSNVAGRLVCEGVSEVINSPPLASSEISGFRNLENLSLFDVAERSHEERRRLIKDRSCDTEGKRTTSRSKVRERIVKFPVKRNVLDEEEVRAGV